MGFFDDAVQWTNNNIVKPVNNYVVQPVYNNVIKPGGIWFTNNVVKPSGNWFKNALKSLRRVGMLFVTGITIAAVAIYSFAADYRTWTKDIGDWMSEAGADIKDWMEDAGQSFASWDSWTNYIFSGGEISNKIYRHVPSHPDDCKGLYSLLLNEPDPQGYHDWTGNGNDYYTGMGFIKTSNSYYWTGTGYQTRSYKRTDWSASPPVEHITVSYFYTRDYILSKLNDINSCLARTGPFHLTQYTCNEIRSNGGNGFTFTIPPDETFETLKSHPIYDPNDPLKPITLTSAQAQEYLKDPICTPPNKIFTLNETACRNLLNAYNTSGTFNSTLYDPNNLAKLYTLSSKEEIAKIFTSSQVCKDLFPAFTLNADACDVLRLQYSDANIATYTFDKYSDPNDPLKPYVVTGRDTMAALLNDPICSIGLPPFELNGSTCSELRSAFNANTSSDLYEFTNYSDPQNTGLVYSIIRTDLLSALNGPICSPVTVPQNTDNTTTEESVGSGGGGAPVCKDEAGFIMDCP